MISDVTMTFNYRKFILTIVCLLISITAVPKIAMADSDFSDSDFRSFLMKIKTLESRGISKFEYFDKSFANAPIKVGENLNLTYPGGDFIALIGMPEIANAGDEGIRHDDYKLLYNTIKRLTNLRFRIQINLRATVRDLRAALRNDRPTILYWTSHGNKQGFFDSQSILVPYNVFEKTSSNIYQLILTSCDGRQALDENYKIPKSLYSWAWSSAVYRENVNEFINSNSWSPFINRPGPVTQLGLKCVELEDKKAAIYLSSGAILEGWIFTNLENCFRRLLSANQNFICNQFGDGDYGIVSLITNKFIEGENWPHQKGERLMEVNSLNESSCTERVHNATGERVCRKLQNNPEIWSTIAASSGKPESDKRFSSRNECLNYLVATDPI